MTKLDSRINGLHGNESIPRDPQDPSKGNIKIKDHANDISPDPGHSIPATTMQIFGQDMPGTEALMNGFAADAVNRNLDPEEVLRSFDPSDVPVLTTLAREFAVFDNWHAALPGPTLPNRAFVHSATTHGLCDDDVWESILGLPQDTIYDRLDEVNASWAVYFEEGPDTLIFNKMRTWKNLARNYWLSDLDKHLKEGNLAKYSFINPAYFGLPGFPASDQHPSHDVVLGELLIKRIYESLRQSPHWNDTVFIITYDEHGGFYDHVATPLDGVPKPDDVPCTKEKLRKYDAFSRMGVRIPAVMVSPWIEKHTLESDPPESAKPTPTSMYDLTSIAATLKKMFGTKSFLTKRDAWAATFDHVWSKRTTPRTDCPTKLPTPPNSTFAEAVHASAGRVPLTDLQKAFVKLAASLQGEFMNGDGWTEEEGSIFVRDRVHRAMGRDPREQPTHPHYASRGRRH